jgi:hypothetical protein
MEADEHSGATLFTGLCGPGATVAMVSLRSGGADALAGALVVVALLVLARKVIRMAGDTGSPDDDRRAEG